LGHFAKNRRVRVTAKLRQNGLFAETEIIQFDTEMAAPVLRNEDTNWHRSEQLHKECEWKQGVSAVEETE
jgi:hypothetical protein